MATKSTKKNKFVKAWMAEHVNDPWVKEATRLGYRSRAAFKLIELAAKDKLIRPGMRIADLGAAPGSWTQVLRERAGHGASIVAIDLLPMAPLPGVHFVQADFREEEGLKSVEKTPSAGTSSTLWFPTCPPIFRAWKRRIRRDRCIWANWHWNFPWRGCNRAAIWSSKRFRVKASSRFAVRWSSISRRSTSASAKPREIAVARSIWSQRVSRPKGA
jgi:hypothetical protein